MKEFKHLGACWLIIKNGKILLISFFVQHPLVDIEIVAFDLSGVHIVAKDDMITDWFKKNLKVQELIIR